MWYVIGAIVVVVVLWLLMRGKKKGGMPMQPPSQPGQPQM